MTVWTNTRITRLASDFLLWDSGKAEGEQMPEALKSDLRDFAGWLKVQHELGPDSPVAWRALRCFGLRQDA